MENTNNNILEIKNLHTYFYTDSGVIKSVDGVDIELREGTTLGIVGESGSGKSVTALSVMGLLMGTTGKVAEGEILFEGRDLTKLDDEERRNARGKDFHDFPGTNDQPEPCHEDWGPDNGMYPDAQ